MVRHSDLIAETDVPAGDFEYHIYCLNYNNHQKCVVLPEKKQAQSTEVKSDTDTQDTSAAFVMAKLQFLSCKNK